MAAAQYFEQVQKIFIAFYQRPADPAGLKYWAQRVDAAGGDFGAVIDAFASSPEAIDLYGAIDATTIGTVIDSLYMALFNAAPDAAGKAFYVDGFAAGTFTAGTIALAVLNGAQNDDLIAVQNKVQVANEFTEQVDGRSMYDAYFGTGTSFNVTYEGDTDAQAARDILKAVTFDAATVINPAQVTEVLKTQIADATDPIIGQTGGKTFTLTAGIDSLTGTAGNDTFSAAVDAVTATNNTLNLPDTVDGGAGTDSLNVILATAASTLPAASVKNIENFFLRNVASTVAQDFTSIVGEKQVWTSASAANTIVTGVGKDAVLGVKDTVTNLTATYDANSFGAASTLNLAVSNAGTKVGAVVTQSTITVGQATAAGTATGVAIDATGANYVTLAAGANNVSAASGIKTLTVTGSGTVAIDATSALNGTTLKDDLTKVDASANTGGVTVEVANIDVVVTGGAGADAITLANATALSNKAGVNLGAGNDKLQNNGSAGLGTSAVLDGGDGTDTIVASLLQVGNQANIKNWEVLDLVGETRTIDASLFAASNFQSVALSGALTGNTVVQKLSGAALNATITAGSGAFDLTAQLANGATSTADTATITFDAAANATLQSFKSTGIETYNIVSGGATAVIANQITTLSDSLNTTSKVVITGANALTIGGITTNTAATTATADVASALTTIDGSAATGNLTITAGASAVIGATVFNTTYTGLTITTGSGNDVIVSAAKNAVISTGAGDDTITITGSGASVNTGAAKTATGDVVNFGGTNQSATFGTDLQKAVIQAGAAAGATFDKLTTITGAAKGDIIDFTAILGATDTNVDTITNVTATIGGAASLAAALDLAAAAGGTQADGSIVYFNWVDGNTYLVGEVVGAADGLAAGDAVVKLVGNYTSFTATDGVVTLA